MHIVCEMIYEQLSITTTKKYYFSFQFLLLMLHLTSVAVGILFVVSVFVDGPAIHMCMHCAFPIGMFSFLVPVVFMDLDLASFKSVRRFAAKFLSKNWPLHILINNGEHSYVGSCENNLKIKGLILISFMRRCLIFAVCSCV